MPKDDETRGATGSDKPEEGTKAPAAAAQPAAPEKASPGPGGTGGSRPAAAAAQTASALLKADHQAVEQLFAEFDGANDDRKTEIVEEACRALILHTLVEEEIFYPACRKAAADEEPLDEAQVEHDSAKLLLVELMDGRRGDPFRDARFKVLAEQVRHHVAEEEKPREGIFAKAQAAGVDTDELGRRIQQRKQQVQGAAEPLRPTRPVSFQHLADGDRPMMEESMPRDYGPERDERGRFISDDDGRGRRERYAAEGSGGRRRYEDDERDYRARGGRGRGQGGWFGDSEGHSEAARRGWDRPDHGPSGWYGDSRGHSEASRRGWDDPDHGPSGWYGDPEGHSEASRRGWDERRSFSSRDRDRERDYDRDRGEYRERDDQGRFQSRDDDDRGYRSRGRDDDDDRGYRSRGRDDDDDRGYRSRGRDDDESRGWRGESERHAEAARRGWDERGGGGARTARRDDDDGRRSSRSPRDDDDDRRGSRGGQGGWFGDSRGHAEAARRGWEGRR